MYFVYILLCEDDSLYTGITTNVNRRLEQHKAGVASKYTRAKKAVRILYMEECPNKSVALKKEAEIKRLSRKQKQALIDNSCQISNIV